jgi:hypothetical protein
MRGPTVSGVGSHKLRLSDSLGGLRQVDFAPFRPEVRPFRIMSDKRTLSDI